jgi:hypothetical protein
MADKAIDANSLGAVDKALTAALRSELQKRFAAVIETRKLADENIDAGRRFVHAYGEFVHYVDAVHRSASAASDGHEEHRH